MSSLNNAEKEALKNITLAMSQEEKSYCIKFYPTEYLQAELNRREKYMNNKLMYLWDSATTITDDMTLNEKEALFNEVTKVINQDDPDL